MRVTNSRHGRGTFHHVRATFAIQRRPTATLLISPNPLYFEAEEAERVDENTYRVPKAWLTVCDPDRPVWKFYAPEATVELRKSVHLENGNFRLFSIPVLYLPYATFPAEKQRNSGFMIPEPGESSSKGLRVWRRLLLGADGLDGHDHWRLLLQQARMEPKRRVAHAALGECQARMPAISA